MAATADSAGYVSLCGSLDGRTAPVMTIHGPPSGEPIASIPAPAGEQWKAPIAVGGGVIVAATHVPNDPASTLRLYEIERMEDCAGHVPRLVPLAPINSPLLYSLSVSPDGGRAILVVDVEQSGSEDVMLVSIAHGAPVVDLSVSLGEDHVFDTSLSADGVLFATADLSSQRRQLRYHDIDASTSLSAATVIATDGDYDIFQIIACALSPCGELIALASTRNGGALFVVSVMLIAGGAERVLYQRPVSWADPAEADLTFDETGEQLLIGYGDILSIRVADASHSLLMRSDATYWNRVAW